MSKANVYWTIRLELGAGSGLVGLAIALALSSPKPDDGLAISMTDQAPMLDLMQRNILLNPLASDVVTADVLEWGTTIKPALTKQPDVLLAAECVYFEPAFPLLLQTLKEQIGRHTICFFCFKKRRKADLRFMKEAKKAFNVEDVTDDPDREKWRRENLFM